jgi:hypothetical protein
LLEAPRGTLAWIQDELGHAFDAADDTEQKGPAPLLQDEAKFMFERFHERAAAAQGEDWGEWCGIIRDLAELGFTDQAAADLIVKRSAEENVPQIQAIQVVELYKLPAESILVRKRLRFLMSDSAVALQYLFEFNKLFAKLKPGNKESEELLRRGAIHDSIPVRVAATRCLDRLPCKEARDLIRRNLEDPSFMVRGSAISLVGDLCTKDDIGWLQDVANGESSVMNRETLQKEIAKISAR